MYKPVLCVLLILFFSCKKEENNITVSYTVKRMNGISNYSISYKKSGGVDELVGPINQINWNSGILENFRPGELASITLNTNGPKEDYLFRIISNGNIIAEQEIYSATSTQSLSAKVY